MEIQQPEDRGILLADILEDIPLEDERWKPLDEKYIEKIDKALREKSLALTASYHKKNAQNYFNKRDGQAIIWKDETTYLWRKLTVKECERLQTLPDDYTEGVSNSRRYKAIGNGWTVDVIAHILQHLTF